MKNFYYCLLIEKLASLRSLCSIATTDKLQVGSTQSVRSFLVLYKLINWKRLGVEVLMFSFF